MQKYFIITLVVLGLLVAIYFMSSSVNNDAPEPIEVVVTATTTETYTLPDEGLMFTYKDGETGFYFEEQEVPPGDTTELKQSITLTPTKDYLDQQDREGGEGSPSWHLAVYNDRFNEDLREWIENNSQFSNVHLAVNDPREVMIAGVDGIRYQIDGLYPAEVIVFMKDDSVFVVMASYLDENSQTFLELEPWLNSFTFVPTNKNDVSTTTTSGGDVDMKVACESALIYMTFMSGEDADRFVAECIAGEHPDVIERYKTESGQ